MTLSPRKMMTLFCRSIVAILFVYILSGFGLALLFSVFENRSYGDSLWWAYITLPTVGYGDMYPLTTVVRVATLFTLHFCAYLVIPLIIGHIVINLLPDINQFLDCEQKLLLVRQRIILARLDELEEQLSALRVRTEVAIENQEVIALMLVELDPTNERMRELSSRIQPAASQAQDIIPLDEELKAFLEEEAGLMRELALHSSDS